MTSCGTFSDVMCGPITPHYLYRGVRFDLEAVREGGCGVFALVDLPFSFVADTVLLPYAVTLAVARRMAGIDREKLSTPEAAFGEEMNVGQSREGNPSGEGSARH
jgi:uncharacterized protein YceK